MASIDKSNLGYLGEDFQFRLVHHFMSDKDFFKDLSSIVDQNMFTNVTLKSFVGIMKDHYNKHDVVPSYDIVLTILREKAYNLAEKEINEATVEKIRNIDDESSEYIHDLAFRFFKQQNIVKTANEILRVASNGDVSQYEHCVELLNEALNKGEHTNFGVNVFDGVKETLSDDYRITIPTGISAIDKTLEGGLGKGELGVIVGPSGFGKAQPLDALIVTPNGFKRMGDMKVGDKVIGRDGKAYNVSGVFPQGMRPIYKVSFSNGTSCECDIEHLWNVNSKYQRSGRKYIKGLSKHSNDKYYAPDKSFKTLTLREILDKGLTRSSNKGYNFIIPNPQKVEFNERILPTDPYLFGYNLHKSKTENEPIPNDYLFNSVENRIALLQGLMDSVAYVSNSGSCRFVTKSEELANNVAFLVRSLGGFASIIKYTSSYKKKNGEQVDCGFKYRVTISMCDPSIELFRLKRKQDRVHYRTERNQHIFMTNAEYVGKKEAQCIMVDSEEHLYLTEDFIVTHNTSLTSAMCAYASTYKCQSNDYRGFKVLQIVFEDREKQIQRKHIARVVSSLSDEPIEAKDLSKPENKEKVLKYLENYEDFELMNNNLRIVKFQSGEISASGIKRFIKKMINNGFKPDLTVVDYFECVEQERGDTSSNDWEKEGRTMRKFESMASELDMALWVPIQGTKDSVNQELVTTDKAGGSVKKIQIAHIIMTIARSIEDIENAKATIAILKNRAGASGRIFKNVSFNNGTCIINCDEMGANDEMTFAMHKENHEHIKMEVAKQLMAKQKK